MIGLDVETTGLDFCHGAKPFMVQLTDDDGLQTYWTWNVNPVTRQPRVPRNDLKEIQAKIDWADKIVLQNPKFDVAALRTVFAFHSMELNWDWGKVYDTLLAGHLLASNRPHDLTTMALMYLGINVKPFEDAIKEATNEARRIAKSKYPNWQIARVGLPQMPSARGTVWKNDMWLPRAIAKEESYIWTGNQQHPWWEVCAEYGNSDSEVTILLFKEQQKVLRRRNLWKIYQERLKILPIVSQMESHGVTISGSRLTELQHKYTRESGEAGRVCTNLAKSCNYDLQLPKSGNNKSLTTFIFDVLKLGVLRKSQKTGKPSLDKKVMEDYQVSLPRRSKAKLFIDSLLAKRKRDTALAYMDGYRRFWLPLAIWGGELGWHRLRPSLNPTGTSTLRWSSQNPNEQNISKQKDSNLRYCFGPAPGREWWSLDAQNIELRLPAYKSGETEQIELFEKPDEPPFFGSNHLLVFSILHPDKWNHDDPEGLLKAKKKYADTWYQWIKNGNFAVQYGAVEQSGTADKAYHVPGAQRRIAGRFRKSKLLNEKLIEYAEKHGYVETMPDKTVDPKRGYPLLCTRTNYGRILPTVPLNYWSQGTACWWMMKAMIRCQVYLNELNAKPKSRGYHMVMQIHDELVFDFPAEQGRCVMSRYAKPRVPGSLPKIRKIQKLMEQGGDDIGIPTPVSIEYHPKNWSEGVSV
ncbi:hypothetical protein LCGC14_0428860 [marine sediment metagenome]|uniref:DNA-directed DNA polymerase family A palm domain-containing protein n=2 Tax=marine sediment metagenome TaxID=412755 RepID=A0A0F9VY12_9ZZZZ